MTLKVARVDTWSASLQDKAGNLAAKLSALANAGINLEFVIARRSPDTPGTGVLFVTPIKGAAATRAARLAGFKRSTSMHTVRVECPDKVGQGRAIAQALADQGLNLRGFSAAAVSKKCVVHIAVDKAGDVTKAMRLLRAL
jgi:hypothetical protein